MKKLSLIFIAVLIVLSVLYSSAFAQPSGGLILFVTERDGQSEVYLMNSNGTNPRNLTNSSAHNGWAYWSPDGTEIYFGSALDGDSEIYVMKADGSDPRNLSNSPGYDSGFVLSPDGLQIAFISDRDGQREVYLMNTDGSNQRKISHDVPLDWQGLRWSPDGQWLAFISELEGDGHDNYIVKVDGTEQYKLSDGVVSVAGVWTIDSRQIIYRVRNEGAFPSMVTFDVTNLRALTDSEGYQWFPRWSRDRTLMAYELEGDIYIANADGTEPRNLTNTENNADGNPIWSPDMQQMAFIVFEEDGTGDLHVINIDGTNPRVLADIEGADQIAGFSWSPDGQKIAYSIFPFDDDNEIYVVNVDGTNQRRLTDNEAQDYFAGWQPIPEAASN